jgi:hypothetical protein
MRFFIKRALNGIAAPAPGSRQGVFWKPLADIESVGVRGGARLKKAVSELLRSLTRRGGRNRGSAS